MKIVADIFSLLFGIGILGIYGFSTLPKQNEVKITTAQKLPLAMAEFLPTSVQFPAKYCQFPEGTTEDSTTPPFVGNSYVGFKEALAFKESRGRYSVVNTLGYMGKYQFGKHTLALLGRFSKDQFLGSPELQERVFDANIARNKWILRRELKQFARIIIQGIQMTESGMLAAAHLAGAGNVKKYIRSNGAYQVEDAYGSTIQDYLKSFAGYEMSSIVPHPRPKAALKISNKTKIH